MSLHIEVKGKGRALVFFHGWGFDHRIWLELAEAINERYQLYLVDLPGFGRSSAMNWEEFKQKLLAQLPEQFGLVGWSMGGLLAMRLALEESNHLTHLISICSSPRFIKDDQWPGVEKAVFDGFFNNLTEDPQTTISQFVDLQLQNLSHRYQNEHIPEPQSLRYGLEILETWDLRMDLIHFSKPTCFMFGRLDAITPRTTMRLMEKIYPNFNYHMFAKAAHIPFVSHQDEFITELERLIR